MLGAIEQRALDGVQSFVGDRGRVQRNLDLALGDGRGDGFTGPIGIGILPSLPAGFETGPTLGQFAQYR